RLGRVAEALACLDDGIARARKEGRGADEFDLQYAGASQLLGRGDLAAALPRYQEALAVARRVGDAGRTLRALTATAEAYRKWHRQDQALELYRQAIEAARPLGKEEAMLGLMERIAATHMSAFELRLAAM